MSTHNLPTVSQERPNVEDYIKNFAIPPQYMNDFKEICFTQAEISEANATIAQQISKDYSELVSKDKPLVVLGLLKGCFMFFADVTRQLAVPTKLSFIQASSYGNSTTSSGTLTMSLDVSEDLIKDQHVIVLEDMVDTGRTLFEILQHLKNKGAASVKLAVLLNKVDRRVSDIAVDYTGYVCPDEFVVGYGLDFAESCRTLPFIAVLKEECYMSK